MRNPEVKNLDGSKYDGNFPLEIEPSDTKTYIQNFALRVNQIDAISGNPAKITEFNKYFDLTSILDYFLFSNLIVNFDGFAKNWQWFTKDGVKWGIGLHDLDNIFGQYWKGNIVIVDDIPTTIYGLGGKNPTKYLHSLFKTQTDARYKELRDKGIFNADNITQRLKDWLDEITYPMLKADLEKWNETPSYRSPKTNSKWVAYMMSENQLTSVPVWNSSTNYAVGDKCKLTLIDDTYGFKALEANTNTNPVTGSYATFPPDLGFYNSLDRVCKTLIQRIALMDTTYNY